MLLQYSYRLGQHRAVRAVGTVQVEDRESLEASLYIRPVTNLVSTPRYGSLHEDESPVIPSV